VHKERPIETAAALIQWKESDLQAPAAVYARGRTVFWDWR